MVINAMAKESARGLFPSIVHVDGSCRIHIVTDSNEPLFQVLLSFKEKTGHGILLNTSFNLAGDPLVETPDEAIGTWKISDIECLWFPQKEIAIIKSNGLEK
jgi:carbamoyltransferase